MKILLKYPTRSRPHIFFDTLNEYLSMADDRSNIEVVVSIDSDDGSMMSQIDRMRSIGVNVFVGDPRTKIEAINADIPDTPWDILVLASDDHLPCVKGWDTIVVEQMQKHFPDLDGELWFIDELQNNISLMPYIGRRYYDDMGYIYHPSYVSLWCDNERTEVGLRDGKIAKVDIEIFRNMSPDWRGKQTKIRADMLYARNNKYYHIDKETYETRKALGFPK